MIEITGGEEVNEFSGFKKIIEQQSQLSISQLEKEVDQYLKMDKLESALKYADSGYQFTEKQLETIKPKLYYLGVKAFEKLFEDHPSATQFIKSNDVFFKILPEIIHNKFSSHSKLMYYFNEKLQVEDFKQSFRKNFYDSIDKLLSDSFFIRKIKEKDYYFDSRIFLIFRKYSDIILEDLTFDSFYEKLNTINKIKKHVSKEWATKGNKIDRNSFDCFERDFKEKGEKKLEELLDKKAHAIEQLYMPQNINTFMVKKINEELKKTKLENLPEEAHSIIVEINQHYDLLKDNDGLTDNEIFSINNLMNKRLSEVIYKYLKVDEDFRETMRHPNGKNTKELMLDSLIEIRQTLENIRLEKNERHLSSLSATNKYLKQRK